MYCYLGWTKEETIESLLRKGGYNGNIDQPTKDSIKLVRYQSEIVKMSFEVRIIFFVGPTFDRTATFERIIY